MLFAMNFIEEVCKNLLRIFHFFLLILIEAFTLSQLLGTFQYWPI